MATFYYLLTGGFLKGYRTQVLGGAMVVMALAQWSVGDMSLVSLVNKLPEIIGGMGLTALGAKVNTATASVGGKVK